MDLATDTQEGDVSRRDQAGGDIGISPAKLGDVVHCKAKAAGGA